MGSSLAETKGFFQIGGTGKEIFERRIETRVLHREEKYDLLLSEHERIYQKHNDNPDDSSISFHGCSIEDRVKKIESALREHITDQR